MSDLINRVEVREFIKSYSHSTDVVYHMVKHLYEVPTIDAVPIKFIDEVIEYLEKCHDYAIHEETKTAWNDEAVALIMLLHEWDAWNECGRTGKYGERGANDGTD